jgi:hypothetical protein
MATDRRTLSYDTPRHLRDDRPRRPPWLRALVVAEHSVYIAVAAVVGLLFLALVAGVFRALAGR